MLRIEENRIKYRFDAEQVVIEAWGDNAVRVRGTKQANLPEENWALSMEVAATQTVHTELTEVGAVLKNGKIEARILNNGKIEIRNSRGDLLLEERWRDRRDVCDPTCSALDIEGREYKPNVAGDYHLTYRLESLARDEKLYGMGQYQQPYLNIKGMDLELAHRNSQASVPFVLSSLGYGMLWNNPSVGRVVFGNNMTSYEAYGTKTLDYWFVAGDSPAEIEEAYASVTGTVPMMPEYGLGFWQCKLRYQTQEELLKVAREYKRRGLPIDLIVVDFFHWPYQGDWRFDEEYWPDPKGMVDELKEMGIELMVSIWPTVDRQSENFQEMLEKGYLIRTERGFRVGLHFEGSTIHFDATNPEAREYVWNKAKKNYYENGIKVFWLDEAEPEYSVYDFDNYRYYRGTDIEIGNIYPVEYAKAFYEGMEREGQENIVNLLRCAWAGSQKYGALVWSGDIASSFLSMRNQLCAGLNMGIAGIPWWTTDIGGFHGGNPNDPAFRELFTRWFQWGAFCPVMRLHGDREPRQPMMGLFRGAHCASGADNEVWSYGEEVYKICERYMTIREQLRDYTRDLMRLAHEKGTPVMRTLFYEFPDDEVCWNIEDQYLYGDKYLVAPILEAGMTSRKVYFPKGADWRELQGEKIYSGGSLVEIPVTIEDMPVFVKCSD